MNDGFFSFTKGKVIFAIVILILLVPILIEIFYTAIHCELYNKNIDDIKFEDFTLENYDPHPPIKGDITVVGGF